LKIQVCLKHGKGNRSIKEPRQKKFKPGAKVIKTEPYDLQFQIIQFF
jgi:hypothetical protein